MHLSLLSALSIVAIGLMGSEAKLNVVRIDPDSELVCLILPPKGELIGDTETTGHVQCTDGKPKLLPDSFFVTKHFETTDKYVQAWGLMDDDSVGLIKTDGGGQYDTHLDSGHNAAPGYKVFVELLEPDSRRWCIRFCKERGDDCNMRDSTDGCEGALGITHWPEAHERDEKDDRHHKHHHDDDDDDDDDDNDENDD
ncbi:hypothetical protein BGZ67_000787 [Mortierella alpina]|nr:hypothetical protein BGZ67_000787 [Mortierella alpina]